MRRLKGCQSGNVPKNKPETSGHHTIARQFFDGGGPINWQSVLELEQRDSRVASQSDTDSHRYNRHAFSPANFVDNDNGELSWGLNNSSGDQSEPSSRRSSRGARPRASWMSADQQGSGPNGATGGGRGSNPPNRNQVVNKLTQIRDYIQQTEKIMSALCATNSPGCQEQHEKLEGMLADLRDSETKLQALLVSMDRVDAKIDRLLDQHSQLNGINGDGPSEDELLRRADDSKRKVEALERQRQELLELQQRAHRQLAEAEAEQARVLSRAAALNSDSLTARPMEANLQSLAERLRNVERLCTEQNGLMAAEHPDEEQAEGELSDTETDYQLVRDKVAQLNAMKAQLAQLQAMMASVQGEGESPEDSRRSQSREVAEPVSRLEGMRAKLNEVNRLVEMVRAAERPEDDETQSTASSSRPRNSEELSVENMQLMTRELEEHTAEMKRERDRLIAARNELKKYASLLPPRQVISSPEDSEHSAPAAVNAAVTPRSAVNEETGSCAGARPAANGGGSVGGFLGRIPPSRTRHRNAWNQSLPTLLNANLDAPADRRRKETRSSQSSTRNSESGRPLPEHIDWNTDHPTSNAMYQTQSQLEESANLCEQMLHDSMGSGDDMTGILYTQQQMLARTVSQCCKLIWLQQRQINELKDAMVLQQSATLQSQQRSDSASQQPSNPPRDLQGSSPGVAGSHPFLAYSATEQNNRYLAPQFFQNSPDYRSLIATGPWLQHRTPNPVEFSNAPPGIFGPEDLGPSNALNNQVPPGNRANNYWDNFRSYSRQNLLSTTKSNEDSDQMRRSGSSRTPANQERTPLSTAIVFPNNQANNPVIEVQPVLRQASALSPRRVPRARVGMRSVPAEPQPVQNAVGPKNTSEGATARGDEAGEEAVTRVRNNVGTGVRNRTSREPPPEADQSADRANNKRIRPGNLNNRSDINNGLFTLLRDNVFQEVTNFIRANETRPNFLIQLFRDLQQVTSDPQRQRALLSLQEVVGTTNPLEVRNNIRVNENRSNLNRSNNADDRIEQIFDQLRENQNTIRQNIGSAPAELNSGSNLENPNISNIRDLASSPRNNLDQDRIRFMRSFFEGSNSTESSKNRNVSSNQENLAESTLSEYERMNPKNVYLSLYDRLVEDVIRRSATEDGGFFDGEEDCLNFEEFFLLQDNGLFVGRDADEARGRCERRNRQLTRELENAIAEDQRASYSLPYPTGCLEKGPMSLPVWPSTSTEKIFPTFLRPMSQCGPYTLRGNDADLAEADQTRESESSESENEYMNPPTTAEPEHELLPTFPTRALFKDAFNEENPGPLMDMAPPVNADDSSLLNMIDRNHSEARSLGIDPIETAASRVLKIASDSARNIARPFSAFEERIVELDRLDNICEKDGAVSRGDKGDRDKTDGKCGGASPKVAKTKIRDIANHEGDGGGESAGQINRPMMDIAGALEHLNFRQEEETSGGQRVEDFPEVEADWELENGLDQVPTRLEKRDGAGADPP